MPVLNFEFRIVSYLLFLVCFSVAKHFEGSGLITCLSLSLPLSLFFSLG